MARGVTRAVNAVGDFVKENAPTLTSNKYYTQQEMADYEQKYGITESSKQEILEKYKNEYGTLEEALTAVTKEKSKLQQMHEDIGGWGMFYDKEDYEERERNIERLKYERDLISESLGKASVPDNIAEVGKSLLDVADVGEFFDSFGGDLVQPLNQIGDAGEEAFGETADLYAQKSPKIAGLAENVGSLIPAMVATAVSGNTAVGTAVFAAKAKNDYYHEYLDQGYTATEADNLSNIMTVVEVGSEYLGDIAGGVNILKKGALKDWASKPLSQAIKGYVIEGGEEVLAEVAGMIVTDEKLTTEEFSDRVKSAFAGGVALSIVMNGVGKAGSTIGKCKEKLTNGQKLTMSEVEQVIQEQASIEGKSVEEIMNEYGDKVNELAQSSTANTVENTTLPTANQEATVADVLPTASEQKSNNTESTTLPTAKDNVLPTANKQNLETTTGEMLPTAKQNTTLNANSTQTELSDMLNNKDLPMQKYQYEISSNEKINEMNKSASGYFNNSEQSRAYLSTLAKIVADKNIEIKFDGNLKTSDGRIARGSYSDGVITINPYSPGTGEFIAIHELTHAMGTKNMVKIIENFKNSNIEFNTEVKDLLNNYNQEEISEEALADICGQLFGTQEFINNVADAHPTLFQKIYSEIKYLWHQFRGYKNQNQFIEDLYFKWNQAYNSSNKLNNTTNYYIENVANYDEIEYNNSKEIKLPKREYAILSGIVNSDSNIKSGINEVETTNAQYTVYFKETGEFKVLDKIINEREDINVLRRTLSRDETTRSKRFDKQMDSKKISNQRTRTYDDGILEVDSPRTYKRSGSNYNGETNSRNNVKYSIQESENNSGSFSSLVQDNKGRTLSQEQQEYFKDSKVRDENGNLKAMYHGTQRADRVGNYFNPDKATSGPMAFFTDSEQIATNYSNDKTDTSLSREYDTEKDLFKVDGKSLEEYWATLSTKDKQKINENGKYVGFDEDWENIVFDKNKDSFGGQYDYYLKNETNNNGIEALYKVFVEDGNLFGEDISKFKQALELAGIDNIDYLDPYKVDKKVYEVYLNIKNPFDTSNISIDIAKQLEVASKKATIGEQYSADAWDKSNISPDAWMEKLNDDIKNNTTHAWTVIPDWVTNVLKSNGYDGILDTGGKSGGQEHQVIIPFYSEQIKNVDNTAPTNNPDIRYSTNSNSWQKYLEKNFTTKGTRTNMQDILVKKADNEGSYSTKNKKNTNSRHVFRSDIKSAIFNAENTPHGLYVSDLYDKDINSFSKPHKNEIQNTDYDFYVEPKNPLMLKGRDVVIERIGEEVSADTGTQALKELVGDSKYEQLTQMDFEELKKYAINKFTQYDWTTCTDKGDILSGLGSSLAREYGYDSIIPPRSKYRNNKWLAEVEDIENEMVILKNELLKNLEVKNNTSNVANSLNTLSPNDILVKKADSENSYTMNETKKSSETEPKNIANNKLETGKWTAEKEKGDKQRKHYDSIIKSQYTSKEAKNIARELMGVDTYVPESNAGQLKVADKRIETAGADNELNSLLSRAVNGGAVKADDIAVGERLIQYYSKMGDKAKLQDAIQATAMAGTTAGQTVQAMSLLNHQTPEGQAIWLQRSVDKMNSDLKKTRGDNAEQFNLTQDMIEKIVNSENSQALENNLNEVYEELGQQVAKTTAQKIDAWRYFSMLSSPRTHVRNITGNTTMAGVQDVKNKVAGVIEGAVSKVNPEMERTHTVKLASKEVKAFAKADIENVADRLGLSENKYNPKTRLENNMRTFKSDIMEKTVGKAFEINNNLLEAEDGWGLKAGYVKALSEYMTANNLTPETITDKQLGKARNYAIQQAKEATFHQDSQLASLLNQLSNKNKFAKFAMDAILPFKKTPINVAKTGIEYSPVGLIKSAVLDTANLRKGNITVNQYIDNISKGLTGTGIALVGYALANCGVLKASGSDDEDRESFEESRGSQNYSITIGDNTYSLDWLAPSGIPLFIGAECYELMQASKEKKTSSSDEDELYNQVVESATNILDSFANAMNPMTEMSMLSGLTSSLKSYDQGSSQMLASIGTNAVKSYVNQFVPTLLGQIAKTTDQYERSTTSTKTGVLPKAIDSTKNQIMSKIPGLRQQLPIKTDIWGNDVKQSENVLLRTLENSVLPWTRKELNSTAVDKELLNVYENTGESSVFPDSINKNITINKQKYSLTSEEYAKYKKQYGQTSYKLLNSLIKSSDYKKMSDSEKQFAIDKVYSYATEQIKVDYAKQNNLEYEQSTLSQVTNAIKESKGDTSYYFEYLAQTQELDKDSEKLKILASSKADNNTKQVIYENSLGKEDKKYQVVKDAFTSNGLDITQYLEYKSQEFTSDTTDDGTVDGKTVSGSKKKKVYNYIESMKATYTQKLILSALEYKPTSYSEKKLIINYVNSLNKTAKEKLEILEQFKGVTIYKNGTYSY